MSANTTYIEKVTQKESNLKGLPKVLAIIIALTAITFSVFHLYTAGFGSLPSWQQRAVHVSFGLLLLFMLFPFSKKKGFKFYDLIPILLSSLVLAYALFDYPAIEYRAGQPNSMDIMIGTLLIILIIEGVRRTNGILMSILITFFLFYIFLGPYFPGLLGHQGYSYKKMIDTLFISTSGIFSSPVYTSSTVIVLFIIFGSFFLKSGAGKFFIDFAFLLVGKRRGGPALASVASSAMLGTITGNGAANVAITGAFTIPMMKRIGYSPKFAAGVESVASQGGQLMPPIMGAAIFIMAEMTGVPYIELIAYALIPALLYFLVAGIIVYLQAGKLGLKGASDEEIPKVTEVLKRLYFFLPIAFIIGLMLMGFSPIKAGLYSIFLTIGLSYLKRENWMSWRDVLACLESAAKSSMIVVSACAGAGIIVGSVVLTGLGTRFSRLAIDISGENLLLLLILVMVASIILGMGMSTVSAYVILAVLAAPALINLGVSPVAAHMFVFYYGVMSGLTPPVAITAYTAAGLAGSSPNATAFTATKIGLGGFIVPFIFVYNEALLLQGDTSTIALSVITSIIGAAAFVFFLQGYLIRETSWGERLLFLAAAITLIIPGILTDITGVALLIAGILLQIFKKKSDELVAEQVQKKLMG
ncbi:TRAP transporter permease [Bacillus sp. B15-48]|uniref:TRAP transporter permease n=1 Tax=Bacillus sp. B15-48 TaxID=1548601 RepID=UPI00193FBA58|nr:TRAP transporter permease [Bacillus sp. B15-48]MBM4761411.1 TRAP transporter fused permease subunit [Bacillus sp. B15-48]